ncbi:MAG TPA: NUDIX hydrolase [Edaphobacter sp.]
MGDGTARRGREYPAAPIVGVTAVVVRGPDVLLVRRGREPMLGAWSLPGGALELGETTAEGVIREIFEETGVRAHAVEIVTVLDRIVRDDDGRVRFHYVLAEWLCVAEDDAVAEQVCGDDAMEARWASGEAVFSSDYDLDAPAVSVIERALKMVETITR